MSILEATAFLSVLAILLTHSSLLSGFPGLYSASLAHRLQTDALLDGHLSLSSLPFGYLHDFNWTGHGMQQNFGIGVPLLRLPFEWLFSVLGAGPFPDRLVLIFYVMLAMTVLNLGLGECLQRLTPSLSPLMRLFLRWYLVLVAFTVPALGALLQGPINTVYHETVFYGLLYAYVLLGLLLLYLTKGGNLLFLVLCLASGFVWLIRLTPIAYGVVTAGLACLHTFRQSRRLSPGIVGIVCFLTAAASVLWCNYVRFGSPFEWGYSGNLSGYPLIDYSTRLYDYPFRHEPLASATKELLGAMFFNGAGISSTVRFRWGFVGYSPPYNLFYLLLIGAAAWFFAVSAARGRQENFRTIRMLLVWGLLSAGLVFIFFLRLPSMQLRYLAEFSAAFFAVLAALLMAVVSTLAVRLADRRNALVFAAVLGAVLFLAHRPFFHVDRKYPDGTVERSVLRRWGPDVERELLNQGVVELVSATHVRFRPDAEFKMEAINRIVNYNHRLIWFILRQIRYSQGTLIDKKQVMEMSAEFQRRRLLRPVLPQKEICGQPQDPPGLMYQYEGWNAHSNCQVSIVSTAFFPARRCLSLNYSANFDTLVSVRVKRDREFLRPVYMEKTKEPADPYADRTTQIFCSDQVFSQNPSLYTIGWVQQRLVDRFKNDSLPIRLNWVNVHDDVP